MSGDRLPDGSADRRAPAGARDRPGRRRILEIDLGAIVANWRHARRRVGPGARCAAVVKADAYGLGVARGRAGPRRAPAADLLRRDLSTKALALRALLPTREIAVLNGLVPGRARRVRRAPR